MNERSGRAPQPGAHAAIAPIASRRLLDLFRAHDLESLILVAFEALADAVACDFASAFYHCGEEALLRERDSRGRESSPAFMARNAEINPAIPLALANPGIKVLTTRTALPRLDTALHQTAFYREVMAPQGWRHSVALCFWSDRRAPLPIFVASIYRSEGRPDFSPHEVGILAALHPFLECAVRRVHEREAATTAQDGMALAMHGRSRGFAMIDAHLSLLQADAVARSRCAAWQVADDTSAATPPDGEPAWTLPPDVACECRQLLREWEQLVRLAPDRIDEPHQRRLACPDGTGLEVTITMVCPEGTAMTGPSFVLEFAGVETVTPGARDRPAAILARMTPAERVVATVLADGLSNQEIADRLGKTIHAVKFLLHRIYRKTGIPSRAALVAALRPETRS